MNDSLGFLSDPIGYLRNVGKAAAAVGNAAGDFSRSLDKRFFNWLDEVEEDLRGRPPEHKKDGGNKKGANTKEQNNINQARAELTKPVSETEDALVKDPIKWTRDEEELISAYQRSHTDDSPESLAITYMILRRYRHYGSPMIPTGTYKHRLPVAKSPPRPPAASTWTPPWMSSRASSVIGPRRMS